MKADFLVIDIGFGLEFFKSNLNFPAYDTYIKLILILTESKEFFGKWIELTYDSYDMSEKGSVY